MTHPELISYINDYLFYHRFTKEEFCRITNFDIKIFNKIINHELYVSIFDFKKLADLIKLDLVDFLN